MTAIISLVYDFVKTNFGESATVLYACEAGSTAKGYAGFNSDHDVRVVVLRDKNDYLKLVRPKDCFERTNLTSNVDMCAYDVTKVLSLLTKSNPNMREWLTTNDDCVYIKNEPYFSYLTEVCNHYLSLYNLACCYQGLATSSFQKLTNSNQTVNVKKALQLSHSMMTVKWMVDTCSAPPLTVQKLSANDETMSNVVKTLVTNRAKGITTLSNSLLLDFLTHYYQQVSQTDFSFLPSNKNSSLTVAEQAFTKMLTHS